MGTASFTAVVGGGARAQIQQGRKDCSAFEGLVICRGWEGRVLLQETAGSTLEPGGAWNTGMLGEWRDGREPEMGCKGGRMGLVLRKEQFDRGGWGS